MDNPQPPDSPNWGAMVKLVVSMTLVVVLGALLIRFKFVITPVVMAFILGGGVTIVLLAYLLGKVILGLGIFIFAQLQLRRVLGAGWWKAAFESISPYRELVRFAVSSNISATIIKIFRESEILWVGYFLSTTEAGYYRVAYMLVSLMSVVTDPLIATVYPELNRLIVKKAWPSLVNFLRKVTDLAFVINLAIGLGFILFGRLILTLYGGRDFVIAYPALIALFVGFAFNYTLFWNRPLLLSFGLPEFPIWVTLVAGLVKVALAFWLVPQYGILAAGALLSYYYIASVGIMVLRGLKEINIQSKNNYLDGQLS